MNSWKNILTKKRFFTALGVIVFFTLLFLIVKQVWRIYPQNSNKSQSKSCYSVRFDTLSKGESFIDATESVLVENISSGTLLLYLYKLSGIKHYVVKIKEHKSYIRINGVVTQEYQINSPFFITYDHNFNAKLEMPIQKNELSGNALKQIASYLTFPDRSIKRKEYFGEVSYDIGIKNKNKEGMMITKKSIQMPFDLEGSFKYTPFKVLDGEEKMKLKDHLQSILSAKINWEKESLIKCDELRDVSKLKQTASKLIKTDLTYDFDFKAAQIANMKKRIRNKNISTFFQSIKLDEKGLLTNEDFLTLRAFIEINKTESLRFIVDELKKMLPDSKLFQALLPILAKPIIPEIQDFVIELSNYFSQNNEQVLAEKMLQLLMQETNPNQNTMNFLKNQNSDTGYLIRGSIARSALIESPEQSQILIDDLLKIHEGYKKDNDSRLGVVEDALGNAGASELLNLVDSNTPEGLSNLRFVKDQKALEILMNTVMSVGYDESSVVNKDAALSALEMRLNFNIEDEESKKEIKGRLQKYLDNLEAQDAQEEMFKRRAMTLLDTKRD